MLPEAKTVVLDPDLLLELTATLPGGILARCAKAQFVIADFLSPDDFLPDSFRELTAALDQEGIKRLPSSAIGLSDLMPLRNSLVLYQVAAIATAREHSYMFASACPVIRRKAIQILAPDRVLCKESLCAQFDLEAAS